MVHNLQYKLMVANNIALKIRYYRTALRLRWRFNIDATALLYHIAKKDVLHVLHRGKCSALSTVC